MVKALGSSEEAVFLQHRLDDMNQRWSDLKAKSASIRSENLELISAVLMSSVYAAQNSEFFFTGETKSDSNVKLLSVLPRSSTGETRWRAAFFITYRRKENGKNEK